MNRLIYGLSALFTMFFLFACDDTFLATDINPEELTTTTNFKIRMTDAPIDYEEVNIDLQGVILYGKTKRDADSLELGIELGTNAGIYNLLDFQNGIDTLIANAMISLDTIKDVRLILGENNSVKVDGEIFPLTIPGNAKNGLRIKLCLSLANLDEFILNIDFDAEKSVKKTGNGYKLKPVIKVLNPGVGAENPDYELEDENDNDDNDNDNDDDNDDDENDDVEDNGDDNEGQGKDSINLSETVLAYIETNFPDYTIKQIDSTLFCHGANALVIKIQDKSDKIYLYFDEAEFFVQQATSIKKNDLPGVILDAINENFKGFKATNPLFKIVLANDAVQYQLSIRKGNEEKVVIIGEDGTIICEF